MLTKRPIRPRSWNLTVPVTSAKSVSSLPRPTLRPGLIGVPRCLTMIDPPWMSCPSKRLTPRRWEFESRPFLELPPAFLCAMDEAPCRSGLDGFDLDGRVVLAVPAAPAARVLPRAVPEDQHLLAAALLDDSAAHRRPRHDGRAAA